MNGKELMESLSYVDEKYIAEAEDTASKRRMRWRPLTTAASAAACLALVLLGAWQFRSQKQTVSDMAMGTTALRAREIAGSVEEAAADQNIDTALMNAFALAEMTVQVVEWTEEALVCIVTDPGTSDYQVNDRVKIALSEGAEQEAPQPAALDTEAEPPQYEVSFLPDQGSDTITPIQWNLLENSQ